MNATAQLYDDAAKEITRLQTALAKAREALAKYADPTNWEEVAFEQYVWCVEPKGIPRILAARALAEPDATMEAKDE